MNVRMRESRGRRVSQSLSQKPLPVLNLPIWTPLNPLTSTRFNQSPPTHPTNLIWVHRHVVYTSPSSPPLLHRLQLTPTCTRSCVYLHPLVDEKNLHVTRTPIDHLRSIIHCQKLKHLYKRDSLQISASGA